MASLAASRCFLSPFRWRTRHKNVASSTVSTAEFLARPVLFHRQDDDEANQNDNDGNQQPAQLHACVDSGRSFHHKAFGRGLQPHPPCPLLLTFDLR
jgi:hypothetical protein